jgi:hypothetical protein
VHHRYQRHRWQICHRCQRHRRQIFPPVFASVVDTGGKLATGVIDKFAAGINDTGGKFATGINDNGGKFAAGVNDTGGK